MKTKLELYKSMIVPTLIYASTYIPAFKILVYGWRLDAGMVSSQVFGAWITILSLVLFSC